MRWSIAVATILTLGLSAASPAHAWKPVMHVTLADEVLADLQASPNSLTLEAVSNYTSLTSGGPLGTFSVDPLVRRAVLDHPSQFRAGVLGPDAYPDMITGQSVIHPHDDNPSGPGTDAWLRRLWDAAYARAQSTGQDEALAFVAGLLVHAAGDMYAHTFVNHYAGGPFEFADNNATRHLVVEGYVAQRIADPASFDISIAGVESFIYNEMIDATRNPQTSLHQLYVRKERAAVSFPFLFSEVRSGLTDANQAWRALDYANPAEAIVKLADAPLHAYRRAWQHDIDRGLRALPRVSTEVARAALLSPSRSIDRVALESALDDYLYDHVVSMLGAPDIVGDFLGAINDILNDVQAALQIAIDPFVAIRTAIVDFFVEQATGRTYTDWKSIVQDPACWLEWESVLSGQQFPGWQTNALCAPGPGLAYTCPTPPLGLPAGNPNCRHELDRKMHLSSGSPLLSSSSFAPAFNTVTISKLIFLDAGGRRALMDTLGLPSSYPLEYSPNSASTAVDNAMVGFMRSLDDSREWGAHEEQLMPHFDCYLYRKMFLHQTNAFVDDCMDQANASVSTCTHTYGAGSSSRTPPLCGAAQSNPGDPLVCPDLTSVAFSNSIVSSGSPVCLDREYLNLGLDRCADLHGAVVDLIVSGPALAPEHAYVAAGQSSTAVLVDFEPVRSPQTVSIQAQRLSNPPALTVQLRPAHPGPLRLQRRKVGGYATVNPGESIVGGQRLDVELTLDCASLIEGEPVLIEACPVTGGPCVQDSQPARDGYRLYSAGLDLPHVAVDTTYEVRAWYLGQVVAMPITLLTTRTFDIWLDRETVVVGNNPVPMQATVELVSAPQQPEVVYLRYAPSLTGPSQVVVPGGLTKVEFTVDAIAMGLGGGCRSVVGWVEAVSELDASGAGMATGRERYAEVIVQANTFTADCFEALLPDAHLDLGAYLFSEFGSQPFPPVLFEPGDGIIDPRLGPRPGPDF